jgi:hypothetical protein
MSNCANRPTDPAANEGIAGELETMLHGKVTAMVLCSKIPKETQSEPSASSGCCCLREFALTTDNSKAVADLSQQATTREFGMKTILAVMGATALLVSAASAAPLNPTAVGTPEASNTEQVRLVCSPSGRCWRTRGPRYAYRNYEPGYRSYNYYGGPGYYTGPGYGYYGGGPSIGFSFGTRGW